MFTSRDASLLVIDSCAARLEHKHVTAECCYFYFAVQKELFSTSRVGALLKQLACRPEEIPEIPEISRAY